MGIIASVLGIVGALLFNPTKGMDADVIKKILSMSAEAKETEKVSLAQQLVNTVTVGDFNGLFTKSNMLQILVISVLFGIATALVGEKAAPVKDFVGAGSAVLMKMLHIINYYAPIGLGCYFASVIGQLGTQIIGGYLKVFVLYLVLSVIYYFIFLSLYAYIAGGKQGFLTFWKNAIGPTVTALATCSSAASIPINLASTKKIGVSKDIADTAIPFGVNTHKDGTVIGGVMKIVFLFGLFGKGMTSVPTLLSIVAVSFLVGAVMAAIPGGGMIGELLILSIYGFSPNLLPVLAVISTIIDAPATVLNTTGNTAGAMVVARFVDGKGWLSKQKTGKE
jgi:Na+/H+-dicarboxylate symporter